MSPRASKGKNKKNETVTVAVSELPPLRYDPLEASFNALHRAGMVGLALQIEAMRKRNETLPEEDVAPVPHLEWIEDGRGIEVTFTMQNFHALFQERYLGKSVTYDKTTKKKGEAESDAEESAKTVILPRLRYLEVFGADLRLQEHVRQAYFQSFFQIPRERSGFFQAPPKEHGANWRNESLRLKIDAWWSALAAIERIEIQKSTRPNIVKYDLKGVRLHERGHDALLLHFWPLAAWFFSPKTLKYEKKKKEIVNDWLPPVVVVPDVSHIQDFVSYIKGSYSRQFEPTISTHLEAALAFYVAPSIAHGQTITKEIKSELNQLVHGASVFVYKRPLKKGKPDPTKQPEVVDVFNETYADATLQAYRDLSERDLKSPLYRALRVENLLVERVWYDGFNKLVDQWPLELFVPVKKDKGKDSTYELQPKASELAQDLAADFTYFAEKENEMSNAEASVPALIDELMENYLRWRVYSKGQTQFDRERMNAIFKKKKDSRTEAEKKELDRYNEKFNKGVNQEFVDFRGATDQQRFAELFISRLFEAGFYTTPEQREMLRPFYEGEQWESGRWLVLMAISAAGAFPPYEKQKPSGKANGDPNDDN